MSCPWDRADDDDDDDGYELMAPVGSNTESASWCGALDLAGNVFEWAADWYDEELYAVAPSRNPRGPSSGEYRVTRGGSFHRDPLTARSAWLRTAHVGSRHLLSREY